VQTLLNSLAASPSTAVALDAPDTATAQAAANVIATVTAPSVNGTPVPGTFVIRLAEGSYHDLTLSTQEHTDLARCRVEPEGSPAILAPALAVVLGGYWAPPTTHEIRQAPTTSTRATGRRRDPGWRGH